MKFLISSSFLVLIFLSSSAFANDFFTSPGLSDDSKDFLGAAYACCGKLVHNGQKESWLYVAAMAHNEVYLGMQNSDCKALLKKYFDSLDEKQQCAGKNASIWAGKHFSPWRYAVGKVPFNADHNIGMRVACKPCLK